ncbi:MAG TPA: DNA-3-methyladenine glycosylase [Candidatus Saccharimonadales bacterium]
MSRDQIVSLAGDVVDAARRLLGCYLVRTIDGRRLVGKIVETEAYHQTDAASHSYRGKTPRTEVMFGPSGRAYVYFTYGRHYCMNVVTGPEGEGSAVLIRALEPIEGQELMRLNRAGFLDRELANGPAKLCQALQINAQYNGHNLSELPLQLAINSPINPTDIIATTRVGIRRDRERLWRFYIRGSDYISRP